VRLFKLLADATRLRILHFLVQQDELHVRALCDLLGQSQPAVSHHLSLLRAAGLIESRRQGKHNFYRLAPNGFQGAVALVEDALPQWRQRNGLVEDR
jgi:ArsR family transcriptional regulator